MARPDFKKWTPHLIVIGLLALLALLYTYPVLQGKELAQHDNISWKAMSHEADEWHKRTGENTLWSNSMFGGMPTYTYYMPESDGYMGGVYTAANLVLPKPANFLLLAMLSFYLLASVLRMNRWLGALGAIAFAFSAYNPIIISAGHDTKMFAIALMPAVFAGFLLLYRGQYLGGSALFAFAMSLQAMSGHYQIVYYTAILLLFAAVGLFVQALREKEGLLRFWKASALAVLTGALGVATVAVGVLPTNEYNKTTMRGGQSELTLNHDKSKAKAGGLDKDYAFQWSNGIGETGTLLVPDLYGGGSGEAAERLPKTSELVGGQYEQLPGYWGDQPYVTGADHYLGAIVCFLAILGVLVIRNPLKWALVAVSALAIIMSWGRHFPGFNYFLFDHLPLLKNFRTPSMVLVIPQFVFPLLGLWGLHELFLNETRADRWKAVKTAAFITGGLALLLGVVGQVFLDFTNPATDAQMPKEIMGALKEDRASLALKSSLLSAFYIAAAAAVLWAFLKDKIKPAVAVGALAALVLVDLLAVDKRYLNDANFKDAEEYEATFQPRPADSQIMADKDPYFRVYDASRNTYNDAVQAYFFKAVGGYSPAKMEAYQDLIDIHLMPQKGLNSAVLDMLNTKYFITPEQQVVPMPHPCGNAWFVDEVKQVTTADEEMLSMAAPKLGDTAVAAGGWDPKHTAIVRSSFAKDLGTAPIGKDPAASVRLTKYGLNDIHFQSNNSRDGLAVFSDIYYDKGWKAFVDGKETPILRANYVLRALRLPAGQHTIDFRFEPASFKQGNTISAVSSVLVILLGLVALLVAFREPKPKAPQPAA